MATEDEYNTTEVYREPDTGKIRVKGATRIEHISDSPSTPESAAINAILDLLEAAGINPES